MFANRHRGEVVFYGGGRPYVLCLTLGAVAELEAAFGLAHLGDLEAMLEERDLNAQDFMIILAIAIRGGGRHGENMDIANFSAPQDYAHAARAVEALFALCLRQAEDSAGGLQELDDGLSLAAMMRFGLGVLRLSPEDFWGMSLVEFFAARAGYVGAGSLSHQQPPAHGAPMDLQGLMQLYPDG